MNLANKDMTGSAVGEKIAPAPVPPYLERSAQTGEGSIAVDQQWHDSFPRCVVHHSLVVRSGGDEYDIVQGS